MLKVMSVVLDGEVALIDGDGRLRRVSLPYQKGICSGARSCGCFAILWAERLRKVTVKAPLQSLFVAVLLGVWVAHRR